jgi:hypothetical protein
VVENQNNNHELDIWSLYLYAMKSPVTREKYQKRLDGLPYLQQLKIWEKRSMMLVELWIGNNKTWKMS